MAFLPIPKVLKALHANPNGTFVVTFQKRTNGETRRMVCMNYAEEPRPASYRVTDCYHVWDMEKGARRQFPLNAVISIAPVCKPQADVSHVQPAPESFEDYKRRIQDLF